MKKAFIINLIFLIISAGLFAQNIKLPDVTTIIEGDSKVVGKEALPDFSDVINKTTGSGTIVPELPNVDLNKAPEDIVLENQKSKKTVFSEIVAGGGYPFLFYSDCNISGVDQTNPFKFNFKIDSANGYNGHSVTDNFSDSNISLSFDKKYKYKSLNWGFNTSYDFISAGLQGQVPGISSNNKDFVSGKGNVEYKFSNGIYLGSKVFIDFFNRYGAVSGVNNYPQWSKRSVILSLQPELSFGWENYGFKIGITGDYFFDWNIFNDIAGGNSHQGDFNLSFQWKNNVLRTYGDVSFAFGNQFTNGWFLIPFKAGVDLSLPVSFANRRFNIAAEGGLLAINNKVGSLERKYKFAGLSAAVSDSADWYGKFKIDVPVKDYFTGNFSIGYNKTAFNKGVWEPDYSEKGFENGLYNFNQKNHQLLTTDFALTFHYNQFAIKGGWHSNWLDVPALEPMQAITLNMSFQNEDDVWGTSIYGSYDVNDKSSLPFVNADCFVQLSPKVRMTLAATDIISVFKTKKRTFTEKFEERGFTAGFFLKFVL